MDAKKLKYLQVTLVVIVVIAIVVGIGPLLVGTFMKKFVKLAPSHSAAMFAKVTGVVSATDTMVVVTSSDGKKYVIEGERVADIKKLDGKSLEVFGRMKRANPVRIEADGKTYAVRFNIDASAFDTKGLAVGKSLSAEELAKLNQRAKESLAFQTEVLAKLGKGNVKYDVIAGKVSLQQYTNTNDNSINKTLVLTDKYGRNYLLVGSRAINPIIDHLGAYQGVSFVMLGQPSGRQDGMPDVKGMLYFKVLEAYFDDLTKIGEPK